MRRWYLGQGSTLTAVQVCICQLSPGQWGNRSSDSSRKSLDHENSISIIWKRTDGNLHLRCKKTCGSHKLKSLGTFMGYLHIAGRYQGRFSRWFVLFPRCDMVWYVSSQECLSLTNQPAEKPSLPNPVRLNGRTTFLRSSYQSTDWRWKVNENRIPTTFTFNLLQGMMCLWIQTVGEFSWQPKLIFWIYPVSEKMEDWNSQVTKNFDIAFPSLHELNIVYVPRH